MTLEKPQQLKDIEDLKINKANKTDVYNRTEIDNSLGLKADKLTTYTKTETDNLLSNKANQTTTYTKIETDNLLIDKQNKSDIGLLTALITTDKTSIVNAINELATNDSNLATNGYKKFKDGFILQWGTYTKTDLVANAWTGCYGLTYTKPFTVGAFIIIPSILIRNSNQYAQVNYRFVDATTFDLYIKPEQAGTVECTWVAIGK